MSWLRYNNAMQPTLDFLHFIKQEVNQKGLLTAWNDAIGFGFITPEGRGERVFAHISVYAGRVGLFLSRLLVAQEAACLRLFDSIISTIRQIGVPSDEAQLLQLSEKVRAI